MLTIRLQRIQHVAWEATAGGVDEAAVFGARATTSCETRSTNYPVCLTTPAHLRAQVRVEAVLQTAGSIPQSNESTMGRNRRFSSTRYAAATLDRPLP